MTHVARREGPRILLLDDVEQDRFLATRELSRSIPDARIEPIENAARFARALEEARPALVVTDYNLRWTNGIDVLRAVHARHPGCPVVMFTASGDQEVAVEAMKAGLEDYVVKSARHLVRLSAAVRAALARSAARRRAARVEERLHSLLEHVDVGVFRAGLDGRLLEVNPACRRLLGLYEDAPGRVDLHARIFDPVERLAVERELAATGAAGPREVRIDRGAAGEVWLSVTELTTTDDGAGEDGAVVVDGLLTDITERHRRMQEAVEENRRKDEFLGLISHELRNPLGPILNSLQVIRMRLTDPAAIERACVVAERQVRNLARLVDDLLDVTRLGRAQLRLRREPVDVAAVLRAAVEAISPMVEQRRHRVELRVPGTEVRIGADPLRLEQVFVNLLTNAARFTAPGGRIEVSLEAEGEDGEAIVRVRDDGVGIPPALLERIFEPFVHAERSLAGVQQWGLGLGLTIARALVEQHGGTIAAHSEGQGRGAEFVVRLPRDRAAIASAPAPAPLLASASAAPDQGAAPQPPAERILVVDDARDAADSLGVMLQLMGHDVQVAYDGPRAVELARVLHPRLVLLDLGMPEMDGYEVARRLRDDPELAGTTLVAVTGYGLDEHFERTRAAGFAHHLVKPATSEDLARLLATL